ncbi:hypothetical protein R6U77_02795 [Lysinibacillus louembei]|uniref:Uncharacterized protein n=1 Tax=Lysinibacillus louembei TaxID=1470088 RepID=A0ABZ0RZ18_9BACI|nr:hypothetical protein [Lysinibacillus louembei]WPK12644.1 hypothetical protein R6U77_02795 [Lysinibacillus louembei]
MILNKSAFNLRNRFICTFKQSPHFFLNGVDMDDVLASDFKAFKMLRVLWKLSFIKIDDVENKALFDYILKANEQELIQMQNIFCSDNVLHARIKNIYTSEYKATSQNIISLVGNGDSLRHEMAIEAAVIDYISNCEDGIFGKWDYISHQVVASPFKPVDYMDKMDVFGYIYLIHYIKIFNN